MYWTRSPKNRVVVRFGVNHIKKPTFAFSTTELEADAAGHKAVRVAILTNCQQQMLLDTKACVTWPGAVLNLRRNLEAAFHFLLWKQTAKRKQKRLIHGGHNSLQLKFSHSKRIIWAWSYKRHACKVNRFKSRTGIVKNVYFWCFAMDLSAVLGWVVRSTKNARTLLSKMYCNARNIFIKNFRTVILRTCESKPIISQTVTPTYQVFLLQSLKI